MRLPAFSTGVVLFFASFPTALTTPTARTNAMPSNLQRVADEFDIKQTGNLFTVLIDSNRFSELGNVFTEDAHANFATNETMNLQGLTAISNFLQVLSNVTSQHSYTTQYANLTSPTTGHFTGYFQGLFYGQGTLAGQVYQSFGTYDLDMVKTQTEDADGNPWRVTYLMRTVYGSIGDSTIFNPP